MKSTCKSTCTAKDQKGRRALVCQLSRARCILRERSLGQRARAARARCRPMWSALVDVRALVCVCAGVSALADATKNAKRSFSSFIHRDCDRDKIEKKNFFSFCCNIFLHSFALKFRFTAKTLANFSLVFVENAIAGLDQINRMQRQYNKLQSFLYNRNFLLKI